MLRSHHSIAGLILAALLAGSLLSCEAAAKVDHRAITGDVVAISDGDSFTMLSGRRQIKVRIHGIDAPERRQPFSRESRRSLSTLIFRKQVAVDEITTDSYGRVVGVVTVGGIDAGLQQLRSGLAWHYVYYAREQSDSNRRAYAAAERQARSMRRGLWSNPRSVAPWDFRRNGRTTQGMR